MNYEAKAFDLNIPLFTNTIEIEATSASKLKQWENRKWKRWNLQRYYEAFELRNKEAELLEQFDNLYPKPFHFKFNEETGTIECIQSGIRADKTIVECWKYFTDPQTSSDKYTNDLIRQLDIDYGEFE